MREIRLESLVECPDKKWLGSWATHEDYDEYIREPVDVYLKDKLVLVYRPAALKTLVNVNEEDYKYWRWVSRALESDQRGAAAGKEIVTSREVRTTRGQDEFFRLVAKGKITTMSEALETLKDTRLSTNTFYVGKVENSGYVDKDEIERFKGISRKSVYTLEEREEAKNNYIELRLSWFNAWLTSTWAKVEDKVTAAAECKKTFVTKQPRGNRCFSNVLGAIDRNGRCPYGRLTATTMSDYEGFKRQIPFYSETNDLLKETMPEYWEFLQERFSQVKDPRYNLFGTCFTSVTVNFNFQTAYHRDGNNSEGGIAVLSSINKGSYDYFGLVFPELRLGFHVGQGDFLAGDNQGLIHGQLSMENNTLDTESIWFVFYSRERIISLDSLDNETCRKNFLDYARDNHPEYSTGEKNWSGGWSGMWTSAEWENYKKDHCPTASNTNYRGT